MTKEFFRVYQGFESLACRGLYYLAKGDFRNAAHYFKKSLALVPRTSLNTTPPYRDDVIIKLSLARVYLKTNNIRYVFRLCRDILTRDPHNMDAKEIMALGHIRALEYSKALIWLDRIPYYHTYFLRGTCYFFTGKLKKSEQAFKRYAAIIPRSIKGYYNLGLVYLKMKEYEKALVCFNRVLRIEPRHQRAQSFLSRLMNRKKIAFTDPKVSMILALHEPGDYVQRTVESILRQSLRDFELIIVDDGPGKDTRQDIMKYKDKRIIYLRKPPGDLASARNFGVNYALGKYLAYCDGTVILYPHHLRTLADFLDRHPEFDMAYSRYLFYDSRIAFSQSRGDTFDKYRLESVNYIPPFSVMHRTGCIRVSPLFNPSMSILHEWAAWLDISDSSRIAHVPRLTAHYYLVRPSGDRKATLRSVTARLLNHRIRGAKRSSRLLEYIEACSLRTIEILIKAGNSGAATRTANMFYRTVSNYQTIACRGICHLAKGEYPVALSLLALALKKAPYRPDPRTKEIIADIQLASAEAYFRVNRVATAIRLCKRALRIIPNSKKAKIQLAHYYCSIDSLAACAAILQKEKIYDGAAFNLQGCYFFKKKFFNRAAGEFQKAAILQPDITPYRHNLRLVSAYLDRTHTPTT